MLPGTQTKGKGKYKYKGKFSVQGCHQRCGNKGSCNEKNAHSIIKILDKVFPHVVIEFMLDNANR